MEQELLAIFGGILIAFATSFHLLVKGRITGMSGLFNGIITLDRKTLRWKSALIASMVLTSILMWKKYSTKKFYGIVPLFSLDHNEPQNLNSVGFLLAGLLVGFGTKLGNGCTSGHGVCGLPRFSPRSFAAVGCFMITGIFTATLRYYYPFFNEENNIFSLKIDPEVLINICLVLSVIILAIDVGSSSGSLSDVIVAIITGIIFALGLIFSGMARRDNILNFLIIKKTWSPLLIFVLCSAVGLNLVSFNFIIHFLKKPLIGEKLEIPTSKIIDSKLVIGASVFGIGWGLGGLCPGPGFILIPLDFPLVSFVWFTGLAAGQILAGLSDNLSKEKAH